MRKILITFLFIFFSISSHAATINSATCSQTDIQNAINSASDFDTVIIPAGSCTWTIPNGSNSYGIEILNKEIILKGSGQGITNITATLPFPAGAYQAILIGTTKPFRITNFTFTGTYGQNGLIQIFNNNTFGTALKGWRIDHMTFNYTKNVADAFTMRAVFVQGFTYGVIDHNTFQGDNGIIAQIQGEATDSDLGALDWSNPLTLGTDNAVYLEDNTDSWTGESFANDLLLGGRIVVRHNNFENMVIQTHSGGHSGRGGLSYEVYNNVFDASTEQDVPFFTRSGTGVVFNNTVTGMYDNKNFGIDNERDLNTDPSPYFKCDGTSTVDGNTSTETGWPCLDQIGRSSGGSVGSQPSQPLYFWNNTGAGVSVVNGYSIGHIKQASDSPTHTINDGLGNPVVDYVVGSALPGYTSYFYPHPLTTSGFVSDNQTSILPISRSIDWSNAGIVGGIPTKTNICSTLTNANSGSDIAGAIASCGDSGGGVVSLASGTYTIGAINFGGRNNVVLRGAGPDKTILNFSGNDSCNGIFADICIDGNAIFFDNVNTSFPSNVYNWTAGYSQGSTVITLNSVTGLSVGQILVLDQINDSTDNHGIFINDVNGVGSIEGNSPGRTGPNAKRSQEQYVKITMINSGTNQVTIFPGLSMPNWSGSKFPQVWSIGFPIQSDGIENLTVNDNNTGGNSNIGFLNAYSCWLKNVKSLNANRNHAWLYQSSRINVQNSYFYGTQNSMSQSYGVEQYLSSDDLIINNIFQHVTTPTMGGNNVGSVIGYNYMVDMYFLNSGLNDFMQLGAIASHDAGTGLNLYEGNQSNGFLLDLFHGTGALATAFRNQLTGYETWFNPSTGQIEPKENTNPIQVSGLCRNVNLMGNVLGQSGYHTVYQDSIVSPGIPGDPYHSIYYLGYPACCDNNNVSGITSDSYAVTSLFRWGNFDYATNSTHFDPSEVPSDVPVPSDHTLPSSLFLTTKPQWFSTYFGTVPFPPIGPDLSPMVSDIPAKLCYDNTAKDINGVLQFNGDNCYSANIPNDPIVGTSYSALTITALILK